MQIKPHDIDEDDNGVGDSGNDIDDDSGGRGSEDNGGNHDRGGHRKQSTKNGSRRIGSGGGGGGDSGNRVTVMETAMVTEI